MEKYFGLTFEEAKKRLEIYGKNEIEEKRKVSALKILFNQFKSPLILLMVFASIFSFSLNYIKKEDFLDSIFILAIILISTLAGFIQEYKAEKSIEALKKLSTPRAKVIREGKIFEIESSEIVPEDLIVIEGGDIIPADAEVVDGIIEVDESILTGESRAVKKKKGDKIFSGCNVFIGKAIAKVYATGMKTEIGKIAKKMGELKEEETPFHKEINKFTFYVVKIIVTLIVITFILTFRKFGVLESFLISIALAVAAVPEGLPAVITASLSIAAKKMIDKNALVRKLAIIESIGSVDVICTDKTGTITEGKMKVRDIWFFEESDYAKKLAIEICYYCNDSKFIRIGNEEKLVGDETDIALKEYSSKFIEKEEYNRLDEIHFTSERKMMTVLCTDGSKNIVFSKGAPEIVVSKCNRIIANNSIIELNEDLKNKILDKNKEFASQAYRVLALAYKEGKLEEKDLIFVGLVLISDPPRKEVKDAVKECYSAGIRIIMITGDNEITSLAVAKEVGIKTEGFVKGEDLDRMSDDEISNLLDRGINIFARTNPFHKLRLLEILKKKGYVVAMTGDGVNDALALKKADVGISMGIKGTEVAKEASDIVLLDDNFATIRDAIKEGRRIYDNMKKFILFLFGTCIAEVFVVLSSLLFLPYVLLYPIQILWINLVTDGPPALALYLDPAEPNIMKRNPRNKKEGIIDRRMIFKIFILGTSMGISMILIPFLLHSYSIEEIRTVVFSSFVFFEMILIAAIRYSENMIGLKYWLENKLLILALIGVIILQILLIYSPLNTYLKAVSLPLKDLEIIFVLSLLCFSISAIGMRLINQFLK
ncbi:MAG: cation-transporting P-type ATPase [Candidatus Aenigmatarchaeota archaeon]